MKIKCLSDGTPLHIGESAKENWELIDNSESEWTWFHLKSFPSSHVIVHKETLTSDELIQAAKECKMSTKYRNLKNIKISYCQISNVRKASNVGAVNFVSNRKVKQIQI